MRHIDKIGWNHISNIVPADEIIELAFSETGFRVILREEREE
jgi:hypothetical protein